MVSLRRKGSGFSIPTRSGWHRHHLLPRDIENYPDLASFIASSTGNLASLGNFDVNGMFLPAVEQLAARERLPLHRGPHRHYNEYVIAMLEGIRKSASSRKLPPSQGQRAIRWLQATLRLALKASARNADVALSSRDPFGPAAILLALDNETDALFARHLGGETD